MIRGPNLVEDADILDFAEAPPDQRLAVSSAARNSTEASFGLIVDDPRSSRRRGRLYFAIVGVGLAGATAVALSLWSTRGRVDIEFDGLAVGNAAEVIADAEALLIRTAEADGAPLEADARCFFAPDSLGPTVVCGPVWLGASDPEQPWLEMRVDYETTDDSASGQIENVLGPISAVPRTFRRPDGVRPASVGDPAYPTTGPRRRNGTLIVDGLDVLAGAKQAFADSVAEADEEFAVHEQAECFFSEGPESIHSVPVTGDDVWCGPIRSKSSEPDDLWVTLSVGFVPQATFGSVGFGEANSFSLRPKSVPEGVRLVRPDGTTPVAADLLDRPARSSDFTAIVEGRFDVETSGSGRLVTEEGEVIFGGFARAGRLSAGPDALLAADEFEFVVATLAPSDDRGPRGVLVVDGTDRPLPNWSPYPDGATLVVSVPVGTRQVDLVAENDGRPQTVSLLDGALQPGYPLALYRNSPVVVERSTVSRVEMPVGEALFIDTNISEVAWSARDADRNWLAAGLSRLTIRFDRFSVDRPCCEVSIGDVQTGFELVANGETYSDLQNESGDSPGGNSPTFVVPEELTAMVLRIDVAVGIEVDDETSTVTQTTELELDLP